MTATRRPQFDDVGAAPRCAATPNGNPNFKRSPHPASIHAIHLFAYAANDQATLLRVTRILKAGTPEFRRIFSLGRQTLRRAPRTAENARR